MEMKQTQIEMGCEQRRTINTGREREREREEGRNVSLKTDSAESRKSAVKYLRQISLPRDPFRVLNYSPSHSLNSQMIKWHALQYWQEQ